MNNPEFQFELGAMVHLKAGSYPLQIIGRAWVETLSVSEEVYNVAFWRDGLTLQYLPAEVLVQAKAQAGNETTCDFILPDNWEKRKNR